MGRVYRPRRKMGDGSVWISPKYYVEFIDEHGRQKRLPASTSQKKAREMLAELETQATRIRNGLEAPRQRVASTPIRDLMDQFLADQKLHLKERTREGYKLDLEDLFQDGAGRGAWLKAKTVEELTPQMVARFQKEALEVMKPRTSNKKLRVLSAMLSWACRQGLIPANPLKGLKLLPDKPQVPLPALEEKEIRKLLEASPEGVGKFWELFIQTGLRKREMASLRHRDVDLQAGYLTVRGEIAKNGRERHIPLSKRAKVILGARVQGDGDEPVFHGIGNFADFYEGCLKVFQQCCRRAQIDLAGLSIHSLRRTFATRMIAKGASSAAVQKLLGHATLGITMEIYTKARRSDLEQAIKKLG